MLKRKFGDHVRSRTDVAMKNEVLGKVLCHNICCVIASQCDLESSRFSGRRESWGTSVTYCPFVNPC
jgi:hypothetical protein